MELLSISDRHMVRKDDKWSCSLDDIAIFIGAPSYMLLIIKDGIKYNPISPVPK